MTHLLLYSTLLLCSVWLTMVAFASTIFHPNLLAKFASFSVAFGLAIVTRSIILAAVSALQSYHSNLPQLTLNAVGLRDHRTSQFIRFVEVVDVFLDAGADAGAIQRSAADGGRADKLRVQLRNGNLQHVELQGLEWQAADIAMQVRHACGCNQARADATHMLAEWRSNVIPYVAESVVSKPNTEEVG